MHDLSEIESASPVGWWGKNVVVTTAVDLAVQGKISKVIVEHCDRLTRFNFKLVERLFTDHDVSVECIEAVLGQSFEAELVKDMLTLMASFSAKIYGKRSHKNRITGKA